MSNENYLTRPVTDYGDIMTTQQFVNNCIEGGFIDEDGHGFYMVDDKTMTNIYVDCYALRQQEEPVPDFPYVVWYNK